MQSMKMWKRRLKKWRNRVVGRFFDTRYGRELYIATISPRVMTMTVDCGDHVMSFSPHDYIGRKIYRKGHFERDHVDRLLQDLKKRGLLRDDSALLELGGNIGTQTVYFALAKAFRQIVSVEPDPRNFPLLTANIAQNNLTDTVTLVNCAAGETEGHIDFFLHRNNHGKSSAIRQTATDIEIRVPVKPIMDILTEADVPADDIGLIWMDIEGYEPVACRAMTPLLARRTPLYMEFSPTFYGQAETTAFVAFLASFYEDGVIFYEDRQLEIKVRDIPVHEAQFDLLLLP